MSLEQFWNKSAMPSTTVPLVRQNVGGRQSELVGGKPITASVTTSSSGTSDFTLQYSLDDPQKVAAASVVWSGVSSAVGSLAQHFASTAVCPDGVLVTFQTPISASANANTLKVLQGEGW